MKSLSFRSSSPTIKSRLLSRGWKQWQDSAPQKAICWKPQALARGASFIVFSVSIYLLGCAQAEPKNKVCVDSHCFSVELAETSDARTQGLMNRDVLPRDRGMLFIFPKEEAHGFWMKNTNFPIDIIWLNSAREVVYIERFAQPCKTSACSPMFPDKKAKYVLEINAGLADTVGIMIGRVLEFKLVN